MSLQDIKDELKRRSLIVVSLQDERDVLKATILNLVQAMDFVLGEGWRDETLNVGEAGDEVNHAWDAVIAVLGDDGRPASERE